MWRYYAEANICYAYMADVPNAQEGWEGAFSKSRWFTRGWTLQELLAPTSVEFYAADWRILGTKSEHYQEIADITKIAQDALTYIKPLNLFSAAERLSWTARRQVTREEDEAYCLLGIFDINMPMLYGEGKRKAFVRLQEAIYNSTKDQSLFLFEHNTKNGRAPLLADSPTCFDPERNSWPPAIYRSISPYSDLMRRNGNAHGSMRASVAPTQLDVSTTLQLLHYGDVADQLMSIHGRGLDSSASHVAVLNYTIKNHPDGAWCLPLIQSTTGESTFHRIDYPVFLPNRGRFDSKVYTTHVFVQFETYTPELHKTRYTRLRFTSSSFKIRAWSAEHVQAQHTPTRETDDFLLIASRSLVDALNGLWPAITVRIVDVYEKNIQVAIHFSQYGARWSIKKASELGSLEGSVTWYTLFDSNVPCDRCSFRTLGGIELYVTLRRLGTLPNEKEEDRYNIIVEPRN